MTDPDRIGVFGGTFDPVHIGHMVAAIEAKRALRLDRLLMVVANDPWQKSGSGPITAAEDRFAVLAAATEALEGIEASRMEIDRGGPSYSADTVAELAKSSPGAEIFLVVGADVAGELDTWHDVDRLRREVTLVVVERAGVTCGEVAGWRVEHLPIAALDISSSDLRQKLAEGRSVEFLIPDASIRCIHRRGLYA